MKFKTFFILFFIVIFSISAFADVNGRSVAANGEIKSLEGRIAYSDGEWFLKTNDKTFMIHLGPEFYREEINLKLAEKDEVSIYGFMYEDDLAPIKMSVNNKDYLFRDENGKPMWSGRGNKQGHRQNNNNYEKEHQRN